MWASHHEELCSDGVVSPHVCDPMVVPHRWVVREWCNPVGQPWRLVVTLPSVHDGLRVLLMAVLWTFRRLSMGRPAHRQLTRNALLDLTTIIPATTCHQRNYVEAYSRYILIAVDDSEASYRAVAYVCNILSGCEGFRVCLLHALPPLPREFLEFGGSEDPQQEEREETRLQTEQARWIEAVAQAAEPVFTRAKHILHAARVPEDAVETQMVDTVNTQDIVLNILETAHARHCGTVVVGRQAHHGLKALLTSHVSDALMSQGEGLAIWVVE